MLILQGAIFGYWLLDPYDGVFSEWNINVDPAIKFLIFILLQLTVSPGLSFLCAQREKLESRYKTLPVKSRQLYYAFLTLFSICGAIVYFFYLLYSDSKILKHMNKRLELEAGAADQTIVGII